MIRERLISFINDVKNNLPAKAPVYSHEVYDIISGEYEKIASPDILIVEGINVLQLPSKQKMHVLSYIVLIVLSWVNRFSRTFFMNLIKF